MIRVGFIVLSGALFVIVPLLAQAPSGWKARVDLSERASDPDDLPDLKVVALAEGFRVTGGPAATFWDPMHTVTGDFTARATFNLMKPSGHVNYYGLIFGGVELDGVGQRYVYFMVAQDGTFIIRARRGDSVQDVRMRTAHAVVRQPGPDGRSTNTLEVRVAGSRISYLVNGVVVHASSRSGPTAVVDGIVGVRVNHLLDVQVERFELLRQ